MALIDHTKTTTSPRVGGADFVMLPVMDSRAAGELQSLAKRDEELVREAARLRDLDAAIAEIRTHAETITGFFAEHKLQKTRLRDAEREAEATLQHHRTELADAMAELEAARSDEERELRRRRVERANDHVAVAERGLEQANEARRSFVRTSDELTRELSALEEHARALSYTVADAKEPAPGGLSDWASQAHASLFVALGQVDAQRERVIREASELATALLGEPTYGSTLAQALARVKAASSK
jgi:chromosome segregation ATPase